MTMMYAQPNRSGATSGDACAAARMYAFILILLGIAPAVSIFVSLSHLLPILPVLALGVLLLGILLVRKGYHGPRFRIGL